MSTGSVQAFRPIQTLTVSANDTTAQAASITAGDTVLVLNSSADVIFVKLGGLGTVATQYDTPIPPNTRMLLFTGPYTTVFSALSNSVNTGTIFVTMGTGTQY